MGVWRKTQYLYSPLKSLPKAIIVILEGFFYSYLYSFIVLFPYTGWAKGLGGTSEVKNRLHVFKSFCRPKISKFDLHVLKDQNIGRLHIAIVNILWVKVLNSFHCWDSIVQKLCFRELFNFVISNGQFFVFPSLNDLLKVQLSLFY